MEACAEASPALSMSNINHIIPEIVGLGRKNFPNVELGGFTLVGVVPMTDNGGAIVFLLVGCLPSVGRWLGFGLALSGAFF